MDEKKEQRQNQWERKCRERIIVIAPIGTKDKIKQHSRSVNAYINKLIEADPLNKENNINERTKD